MRLPVIALLAAALLGSGPAAACGACDEDKVAATYDQAVIDAAKAGHRQVVFVAVNGPVDMKKIATRLQGSAGRIRGVQAGSLRTSGAPPAFSFTLDARADPQAAVATFRGALAEPKAQLALVRIMRDGALIEPQ
jgi:hypothetical protein